MSVIRSLYCGVMVFWLFACLAVQASTFEASTEQVKARLIASVDAVHPGDDIQVGVHQWIIPHWHTYWINPGDSGIATTIKYDLPAGATVTDIQWPTPGRMTLGPVTNYGYEHEVTLLSTIHVPEAVSAGSVFPINAVVNWLVCEEECIPQQVELSLQLPVVAQGQPAGSGSPLIAKARSALPVASPWPVTVEHSDNDLLLRVGGFEIPGGSIKDIWFYPTEWGRVAQSAAQTWRVDGNSIELKFPAGDAPLANGENLNGVLVITENSNDGPIVRGFTINPVLGNTAKDGARVNESEVAFVSAILFAFLGGVILNLMPCVFPVLSIKALSLLKHAQHSPQQTRLNGLVYSAGVLVSFALLGGVLIALKASGTQIGWGFQFQSPVFVLAVTYLIFAAGLSLSGVFTIGNSVVGIGSSLAERSGLTGSFFTGVLATIVATPCTAPFMGAALGFALTQPGPVLMAVFLSLGSGLAFPYLLLSLWPSFLQRRLPKPGIWMDRLKQALAFPMYGATVWLVWVLAQQTGVNGVAVALGGIVAIAFAAWLYEITKYNGQFVSRSGSGIAALVLLLSLTGGYFGIKNDPVASGVLSSAKSSEQNWEAYTEARFKTLRAEGKPVFLNFTAAWCISCLVNEKVALSRRAVIDGFKKSGITYLKGDWTNRNIEITRILAEFGRSGVPLYVYYPSGINTDPVVLPQILTPEIVTRAVTVPASTVSLVN